MKSIVIGSSGFLGTACVQELLNRGENVVAVDLLEIKNKQFQFNNDNGGSLVYKSCNILNKSGLIDIFNDADEIYLLAGKLGTSELEGDLRSAIEVNIIGALEVFEAALICGVPRVFLASKPNVWLNTYSITKGSAEKIAHLFTRYNPIKISVLSYFNLFGQNQKLYPIRKIIPIFAAQAIKGLPIQIYGDGIQTVDMLYVVDAARITVEVMRNEFRPITMDCGSGIGMSVIEVANSVNSYFNNQAGIKHIPMRKGETKGTYLVANTIELENTIKDLKLTPYKEALSSTLEYYKNIDLHKINTALNYFGIDQPFDMSWI